MKYKYFLLWVLHFILLIDKNVLKSKHHTFFSLQVLINYSFIWFINPPCLLYLAQQLGRIFCFTHTPLLIYLLNMQRRICHIVIWCLPFNYTHYNCKCLNGNWKVFLRADQMAQTCTFMGNLIYQIQRLLFCKQHGDLKKMIF